MRKLFPKILFSLFCGCAALLFSSCSPDFADDELTGKSGLKIALPSSSTARSASFSKDDVESYEISVSSSDLLVTQTGFPGETIEILALPLGEYDVKIDAKNSSGEIIAWGEDTATVQKGETTFVTIRMHILEYYTVSFDSNGGEGSMSQVQVIAGKNFLLPGCGFTAPENKVFSGWAVRIGTEFSETVNPGDSYALGDDTTFYAIWVEGQAPATTYTVRFVDPDGNEIKESQTVEEGGFLTYPGDAVKENFVFDEWYNGANAFDFATRINSDLTLVAGFKPQQVTFSVATGTVDYGTQVVLSCVTPGAVIHYLLGNRQIPDEDSPVYDGPLTINESTKINAIAVVPGYPKSDIKTVSYTVETVTLTFNSAYGDIPDPMTIPKNSPLNLADLPAIGYYATFNGWFIGANQVTDGMLISEDTTINASWSAANINILNDQSINNTAYNSDNLTDGMELCFDSSLDEEVISAYFENVVQASGKKIIANMKYYTNSLNGNFWIRGGIKKIILPDNLTALYSMTFTQSEDLEEIEISENNEYFSTEDGVLFKKDKTTLLRYPPNKAGTSYTLPDTVNSLGFVAFSKTKYLEEIPNFSIIQYMTEMDIFSYSSIKRIALNSSIQSFAMYTFENSKLEEIELPASLKTIGGESFSGCTNLTKVVFKGTIPPALSKPNYKLEFENTNASLQIFVPAGSKNNYLTAETWSNSSINALAERLNEIIIEQ